MKIFTVLAATFLLAMATRPAFALDDHNPIGVTGAFEGMITTGCAYNVLSHNARREVEDIVVPGAIGKYGLKMTRYYNSRRANYGGMMGPGWTHEYMWVRGNDKIEHPNGDAWDSHCTGDWGLAGPLGVSEWPTTWNGSPAFRLADGGTVVFENPNFGIATKIIDPYGQITAITLDGSGRITLVTEPGGRYLKFFYQDPDVSALLTKVEAHGLGNATVTDYVVYRYAFKPTGGSIVDRVKCLTQVDYSDAQHAKYTWQEDNQPENPTPPCPCPLRLVPLVIGCDDVRYHGAMRRVAYKYPDQPAHGAHGDLIKEMHWDGVPGNEGNGPMVSKIDPRAPGPLVQQTDFETDYTETRGDGPTRTFHYTPLHLGRATQEGEICPTWHQNPTTNPAPQQFLQSYTDFQGHTTRIGYDPVTWYITSVEDANHHTTTYDRGPPPYAYPGPKGIGEIKKITHQDTTHIDYTYYDESPGISGHYLKQITDERGNITYHYRDANHRITHTDHKDSQGTILMYEDFKYTNQYTNNPLGLLLTHHLPSNASANGAYVHFKYDSRGLLIAKTNPTTIADWQAALNSAPKTEYTYYASGPWTDRVQTMTLPANGQGLRARETYEYDVSANNTSRGLVTKIKHNDPNQSFRSFFYDVYGNKLWEENEKRQRTSYIYDEYNRVTKITDPLLNFETFSYLKPGANSSYLHTTSSIYAHTSRAAIVTTNTYDENFRKTSTKVGSSTTSFAYDNVGNVIDVTDPRGKITHNEYDNRNRKAKATEAYGTGLAATTVWHYDGASNINRIDRPDGHYERRGYDALNRMGWQQVQRQIPNTNESEDLTTGFGYWPSGKLLWVQDPNHYGSSLATYFAYNESDQMIAMYYPDPTLTTLQQWSYDDAGNLASRTTVNNETQSFTYDIRNRKTGMSWSNGADSASFTYDDVGRLLTATNSNSIVTRAYDAAGRLTQDQQAVTGLGIKNVTYPLYDDDGRVKQIQVAGAYDYTFSYDGIGRFEKIISGGSTKVKYEYDLASNITRRYSYPGGGITIDQRTPRDSLNRISSRWIYKGTTDVLAVQGYVYDHMNRLGRINWGGVFDWFGYYWDGELLASVYGIPQDGPQQPQEGQDPDLDSDGSTDPWAGYQPPEVVEAEPTEPAPMIPPRPRPTPYPRPTPSPTPMPSPTTTPIPFPNTLVYVYDQSGNRTWMADDVNGGKDYVPNDLNQYTSITGSTISNGNEHEVSAYKGPTDAVTVNYSYINDEHLKQVSAGGITYTLAYDALGRCVKRALSANVTYPLSPTTYYIYDGEKPILEYNGANVAKNVYGKGIDEILMRTDPTVNGGAAFYYGHDHEGSVTHLINASGTVIESYQYDAFGAVRNMWDRNGRIDHTALNNRFLFTGREYAATYQNTYVPAFNFYEYRARAYHPGLGRFISEDHKLADTGDYNLFRYCHNDPLNHTDPMGTEPPVAYSPRQMSQLIAEMKNAAYNYVMAAAQWQGSNLMQAVSGAAGIGMAGYQAMGQLSLTLGSMMQSKAAGYAVSRANTDPHPRIIQSSADSNGYVQIDPGQRTAFQQAYQIVKANTDSQEAIVGVTYNGGTRQYGVTPTLVRGTEFQGGQTGQLPPLPKGNYAYAGQVHSHTNRSGFSGYDIRWANENRLPIGLYSANRGQLYVPLFHANPYSSSVQGAVLPFGD